MNNLISLNKITKSFSNNKKINVLKKISYSFTKGKIYSLMVHQDQENLHYLIFYQ